NIFRHLGLDISEVVNIRTIFLRGGFGITFGFLLVILERASSLLFASRSRAAREFRSSTRDEYHRRSRPVLCCEDKVDPARPSGSPRSSIPRRSGCRHG